MTQQYGSLINHMYGLSSAPIEPEVGMGCTILHWSDRSAGTIVEVRYFQSGLRKGKPSIIFIREDIAKRTDQNGMSENQEYEYTPNPHGLKYEARVNNYGQWRIKGTSYGVLIGSRRQYHDYSF